MFIIKLGGSVITDKSKEYAFKGEVATRLAREIRESEKQTIIVHGAGSFGHPLAKKYELHKGYKTANQIKGIAEVQRDVKELNLKVINAMLDAGIHAVSLSPRSIVRCQNKEIWSFDADIFRNYLELGMTPVTFGDVVLDYKIKFCICSGDQLMLRLAKELKPEGAIFVTDVDGIYTANPMTDKNAKLLTEVMPDTLKSVSASSEVSDVTGGIASKLQTMFEISKYGIDCIVVNGNVEGRLKELLFGGRVVCTRIKRG